MSEIDTATLREQWSGLLGPVYISLLDEIDRLRARLAEAESLSGRWKYVAEGYAHDYSEALSRAEAAEACLAAVRRALDDEIANLADDGARLSHAVVRRIEAAMAEMDGEGDRPAEACCDSDDYAGHVCMTCYYQHCHCPGGTPGPIHSGEGDRG